MIGDDTGVTVGVILFATGLLLVLLGFLSKVYPNWVPSIDRIANILLTGGAALALLSMVALIALALTRPLMHKVAIAATAIHVHALISIIALSLYANPASSRRGGRRK